MNETPCQCLWNLKNPLMRLHLSKPEPLCRDPYSHKPLLVSGTEGWAQRVRRGGSFLLFQGHWNMEQYPISPQRCQDRMNQPVWMLVCRLYSGSFQLT